MVFFCSFFAKNEMNKRRSWFFTIYFVSARFPWKNCGKNQRTKENDTKSHVILLVCHRFVKKCRNEQKKCVPKSVLFCSRPNFFFGGTTRSCWNDGRNGFPRAGKIPGRKWPKRRVLSTFWVHPREPPNGTARTKENEKMRVWSDNWRIPIVKCHMFCRFWGGLWRIIIVKCHMFSRFWGALWRIPIVKSAIYSVGLGRIMAEGPAKVQIDTRPGCLNIGPIKVFRPRESVDTYSAWLPQHRPDQDVFF